jgi:hypothetical protein
MLNNLHQTNEIKLSELSNLLASLHIGEGLKRKISHDCIALERLNHHLTESQDTLDIPVKFPLLAEDILKGATALGPQVDTKKACNTAFALFEQSMVRNMPIREKHEMIKISQSLLISSIQRYARDHIIGIPTL